MNSSGFAIPAPPGWPIDANNMALDADFVPSSPGPDGGEPDASESSGPPPLVASESEGDGADMHVDASESSDSGSDESFDLLAPDVVAKLGNLVGLVSGLGIPWPDPQQTSTSASRVSERKHEEIDESIRAELDPIVGWAPPRFADSITSTIISDEGLAMFARISPGGMPSEDAIDVVTSQVQCHPGWESLRAGARLPGVVQCEVAHPQASESERGDAGQHDFTCDFAESEVDYGDVEEDAGLDVPVVSSMTEKLREVVEMNDSNEPMAWFTTGPSARVICARLSVLFELHILGPQKEEEEQSRPPPCMADH